MANVREIDSNNSAELPPLQSADAMNNVLNKIKLRLTQACDYKNQGQMFLAKEQIYHAMLIDIDHKIIDESFALEIAKQFARCNANARKSDYSYHKILAHDYLFKANKPKHAKLHFDTLVNYAPRNNTYFFHRAIAKSKLNLLPETREEVIQDLTCAIWLCTRGINQCTETKIRDYLEHRRNYFMLNEQFAEALRDHQHLLSLCETQAEKENASINFFKMALHFAKEIQQQNLLEEALIYYQYAKQIIPMIKSNSNLVIAWLSNHKELKKKIELLKAQNETSDKNTKKSTNKASKNSVVTKTLAEKAKQITDEKNIDANSISHHQDNHALDQEFINSLNIIHNNELDDANKFYCSDTESVCTDISTHSDSDISMSSNGEPALPSEALSMLLKLKQCGANHAYVTGGCSRHAINPIYPFNDIDIACDTPPEQLMNTLAEYKPWQDPHHPNVICFHSSTGTKFDIRYSEYLKTNDVYSDACHHIDSTVGGLYINDNNELTDPTGRGFVDLTQKTICLFHPSNDPDATDKAYHRDPILIMRNILLAANLSFKLSDEIRASIPKNAVLLGSPKVISQFNAYMQKKIIALNDFVMIKKIFRFLINLGVFAALFPESEKTLGLKENIQLTEDATSREMFYSIIRTEQLQAHPSIKSIYDQILQISVGNNHSTENYLHLKKQAPLSNLFAPKYPNTQQSSPQTHSPTFSPSNSSH